MHRCKNRTEAWIVAAILVVSLVQPFSAVAQDNSSAASLRRSLQSLKRTATEPAETDEQEPLEAATDDETAMVEEPEQAISDVRRLSLVIGQSKTVTLPEFAKTVKIDNPSMVDAKVNKRNPTELLVTATALKPGIAQITVTDRRGQSHLIDVTITSDAGPLQQAIRDMFPNTNVQVIPAGETGVAVIGFVDNPQEISAILDLADKFYPGAVVNGLKAVGPQQVQLRVMIAEVNRTKLRELGFNFLSSRLTTGGRATYFDSLIGGLVTETPDSSSAIGLGFNFSPDNNILFGRLGNRHEFRGFLRALKQEGLAKIIAEPTLVTFSGRAASMVVGGEFPIIVPGQQGTFTVEFREYGTRLEFVPIVLGGGRIRLEVRPELSELDYANGVVMQGFTIPGIIQRRVDTSLELNTGETYVAGGMIRAAVSATTNKVPYIGDVPILGAGFRTVSYSHEEKELIVMVTPELVEPLKPGQRPCAFPGSESVHPTNGELFFKGNVEAPACNVCEISRRTELNLPVDHVHTKQPCVPRYPGVYQEASKAVTAPPPVNGEMPQEEPAPSQAQRPASLPGLIGPLGYDAGR